MPRDAKRQSSSKRGLPLRRISASAERRPAGCISGGTARHARRTLERSRQKDPCASAKRRMASRRALAFATRRPKSCSHQSGGTDGSTQKFETGRPTPAAHRKIGWPKRLGGGACRDDLSLVQIDFKANTSEPLDKGREGARRRKSRDRCHRSGNSCASWMDSQTEEYRT